MANSATLKINTDISNKANAKEKKANISFNILFWILVFCMTFLTIWKIGMYVDSRKAEFLHRSIVFLSLLFFSIIGTIFTLGVVWFVDSEFLHLWERFSEGRSLYGDDFIGINSAVICLIMIGISLAEIILFLSKTAKPKLVKKIFIVIFFVLSLIISFRPIMETAAKLLSGGFPVNTVFN